MMQQKKQQQPAVGSEANVDFSKEEERKGQKNYDSFF
jgi:hypothetical protein